MSSSPEKNPNFSNSSCHGQTMEQIKTNDTSTFKIINTTITNEQIQKEKEKEDGKDFKLNNYQIYTQYIKDIQLPIVKNLIQMIRNI